jgi:Ca-activated chloride channel family protein
MAKTVGIKRPTTITNEILSKSRELVVHGCRMTNMATNTHHSTSLLRLLAAVLSIVLLATACGSDASDSSTDEEASFVDDASDAVEETIESSDELSVSGTDSEESFVVEEEAMEEEDAMADDAMEESAAAATTTTTARDIAEDSDDGGGLFGTLEETQPEPDIVEPSDPDPRFTNYGIRTFIDADDDPLSTFSLDVDTGSYTIGRRYVNDGGLPPRDSVRVEEYVNAFDYDYDAPRDGLDVQVDGTRSPFDEDTWIVRVGVSTEEIADRERQPVALTFVVDTSGSMNSPDRLGLVKDSLTILVEELERDDTVAIVTYSGSSGIVLEPTAVRNRDEILDAIDGMSAGGSTNLQAGLDTGYDLAREAFRDDGVNRVIVASDGLANAGITSVDRLAERIRDDADDGIGIVTVGYGLRGFNDTTMEQLADQGDGFYAYVDTIDEAERLFEEDLTSTLITAAIDAKVQVEFEPDVVEAYRLIGYENRAVLDQDFRNDEVDAGELGAGHQATALYEIELARNVDIDDRAELGVVNLRWEDPETGVVQEIDTDIDMRDIEPRWSQTDVDLKQAVVVATLAELLRDNPYADDVDVDDLAEEVDALARDIDTDEFDQFADMVDQVADRR